MLFLITGTGRCGTLYAARYLQALGLDIKHEKYGRDGTSNWWLGVPWDACPVPKFDRILHIYRYPLSCISSMTTCPPDHEYWVHSTANSPIQSGDPLLLKAMKHWLYWNACCELIADKSVAIENWTSGNWISDFFGVPATVPPIPNDTHTWKGRFTNYTWKDLDEMDHDLTRLIRRKARQYGYKLPDETDFDRR